MNDDAPHRSKRHWNEGGDPDDQRREVKGLMEDARRPARTAAPIQTALSPGQETSSPVSIFLICLQRYWSISPLDISLLYDF